MRKQETRKTQFRNNDKTVTITVTLNDASNSEDVAEFDQYVLDVEDLMVKRNPGLGLEQAVSQDEGNGGADLTLHEGSEDSKAQGSTSLDATPQDAA